MAGAPVKRYPPERRYGKRGRPTRAMLAARAATQRWDQVAMLVASGAPAKVICARGNITRKELRDAYADPKFSAQVDLMRSEIAKQHAVQLVQSVQAEGLPTLKRMKKLRDQGKNLGVAFKASAYFLDQNEALQKAKPARPFVNITIGEGHKEKMRLAMGETKRVDDDEDDP